MNDPNIKESQVLDWLLEKDPQNPSIRYLALKDLLDLSDQDEQVQQAYQEIWTQGPIPAILAQQHPLGYWVNPGPGYYPKYTGSVWQVIFLAQLGADNSHASIQKAGEYLLENTRAKTGGFSLNASGSGAIHCLQGNLCKALLDLGFQDDTRLEQAIAWMAASITGDEYINTEQEAIPIHYYRSGISAPGFYCSANDHQPCAWGAVKMALALTAFPAARRTPVIQKAIRMCGDFLLSVDPAQADYPHPYAPKPSTSWFKFGFPLFYVTDMLQILESLAALGLGNDARLQNALTLLQEKQDADGRWSMEYTYNGKTWTPIEQKGKPSKWVTLRVLRVLKNAAECKKSRLSQ